MTEQFMTTNPGPTNRKFGLVFALFFTVSGIWLLFKHDDRGPIFLLAGFLFLLTALLVPAVLGPINRLWMKFGELLHKLISPVVLGVVFYLLFMPLGAVMRTLGHDPLKRFYNPKDPKIKSYWEERSEKLSSDSFKNQF